MPIPAALVETWNGLLDLLYPPKCLVCRTFGPDALCESCRAGFPPLEPPLCAKCGASAGGRLCPDCGAGAAHHFAAARAAGRFGGTLREAILRLKYDGKRRLAAPLGAYLAEFLRTNPFATVPTPQSPHDPITPPLNAPTPEHPNTRKVIVPVPLHPSRLRERGFNQAALLAREVGQALDLPVLEAGLRRVRRTRPQVQLRPAERAANVRDAFAVPDPATLRGQTVLLVDDVITTMHTVDECARVLMDAGVRTVHVVAAARGG